VSNENEKIINEFDPESLFTPWTGPTFGSPFEGGAPDPLSDRDGALNHPAIPDPSADAIAENARRWK